jgi:hypothetical protein
MPEPSAALELRPGSASPSLEDVVAPAGIDVIEIPSAVATLQAKLGTNEQTVRMRVNAQALLALAQAGHTRRQIATALKMTPNAVKVALWRLRSAGLLNDLRDKLANDSAALAVDSLNFHLRKKDKDVTIETLKGLGHFKNHSNTKHEGGAGGFALPPLQVNVVFNQGAQPLPGQAPDFSEAVVGVPRDDA